MCHIADAHGCPAQIAHDPNLAPAGAGAAAMLPEIAGGLQAEMFNAVLRWRACLRIRAARKAATFGHPPFHPPNTKSGAAKSLNDRVGEREQLVRHGEAERFRGLEIDDQLELCRLHDGQIGRLLAFKDSAGIEPNLTPPIR